MRLDEIELGNVVDCEVIGFEGMDGDDALLKCCITVDHQGQRATTTQTLRIATWDAIEYWLRESGEAGGWDWCDDAGKAIEIEPVDDKANGPGGGTEQK